MIPIHLPALRERIDDIPLLLQHFIERFNRENNSRLSRFSDDAVALLQRYAWPGNVRELENLVERMSVLVRDGEITPADLPERFLNGHAKQAPLGEALAFGPEGIDFNSLVDDLEMRLIGRALELSGGVKNKAAQLLNIKRTTLVEKLKKK